MTYLQLVNSVLRKLREDEVATVQATTYSKLIGDLVNIAKDQVETSWQWNSLRYSITVNTVPDVFRYILTGVSDNPLLLDIWNDTDDFLVRNASIETLNSLFIDSDVSTGSPYLYGINGVSNDGDLQIDLYPVPDAAYNIDVNMVLKQGDLSVDADVVLVNAQLVILSAWALAISERGEDGGTASNKIEQRYFNALSDAIAIDAANMHSSETTWGVV
jgi:hypothetical protein